MNLRNYALGGVALMASVACSGVAYANSGLSPFVKSEYALASGHVPVTLEQLAADPQKYFRNKAAYDGFKWHLATTLGVSSLSDAAVQALLGSDKVRLVSCQGNIKTAGLRANGTMEWFERGCYTGEQIIEVKISAGWVAAGSLACLNPVSGIVPKLTVVTYVPPPQSVYVPTRRTTIVTETPGMVIGGSVFTVGGCCCVQQRTIGTPTVYIPGNVSVTVTFDNTF